MSLPSARSTGFDHFLDRLATDAELAGDVGLADTVFDEGKHQIASSPARFYRFEVMLDRLCPSLFDCGECFFLLRCVCHVATLSTSGCVCQPLVDIDTVSRRPRLCGGDRLVMLNNREWFVELVQVPAPLLVFRRATKPLGVVLDTIPLDEQQVVIGSLDAARQPQVVKARHAGNQRHRIVERGLKCFG
jgi:hypothetical protein